MDQQTLTRINRIKKFYLRYKNGLNTKALRTLFPNIDLDFDVDTYVLRHHDDINIAFIPFENGKGTPVIDMLQQQNRETSHYLGTHHTLFLVFDPHYKKYKYYGDYSSEEVFKIDGIDPRNPSDVQVVQGFISYYEKMIRNSPIDQWNWNLKDARIYHSFNGEKIQIALDDQYLKNIFTAEAWFKDAALDRLFKKIIMPFATENEQEEKTVYCRFYLNEEDNNHLLYAEVSNERTVSIEKALFIDYGKDRDGAEGETPEIYTKRNALDYIFKPYLYHAFIEIESIPGKTKEKILEELGKTYKLKIKFQDTKEKSESGSSCLVFAASKAKIAWIEVKWRSLNSNIGINNFTPGQWIIPSNQNVNLTLSAKLDDYFSAEIDLDIHRVGQANFICGYPKGSDSYFVFDCGLPIPYNIVLAENHGVKPNDPYKDAFVKNIKPKLIIISHWHYDHFSGLFSLDRDVWNNNDLIFIAPNKGVDKFGNWGTTFLRYLESKGSLYLIDAPQKYDKPLYECNGEGVLYQGKCNDVKNYNDRSLLLRTKKTILPGDCSDNYWPSEFDNPTSLENIVLPHHGAQDVLQKSNIATNVLGNLEQYNIYICAGFNNVYKHPAKLNWFDPRFAKSHKCKFECTNIAKPFEDPSNRKPNRRKAEISIIDA